MFRNRLDAAIKLGKKLQQFKNKNTVVMAIPRGGLPLGEIIARELEAPLDVVLSKKIGHPSNKEYAIGAVSLENVLISDSTSVSEKYIEEETARIREKLKSRQDEYYRTKSPQNLNGKIVIIVDDGIATGNTIMVTAELIRNQNPKKVIVAVPVAPKSAIKKLNKSSHIDQVICLLIPPNFRAVGQFYEEFDQVTDKEAIQILRQSVVD
ncbi:putative phosphoribosyltransferase [Saonia flava]|uniref:Putative phosphoribosyltransferase n=1 Tax=Saonia flava TaxID=523696 RepID=A0A846QV15_9FLAO|nr:phosphoribosyltransferase family protein [Saonia flava]NJB70402.1 putative phosphoribosyltransferase [Saonia flava]